MDRPQVNGIEFLSRVASLMARLFCLPGAQRHVAWPLWSANSKSDWKVSSPSPETSFWRCSNGLWRMKSVRETAWNRALSQLTRRHEEALLSLQLPCGGWGYSRQWATEPTCMALLALRFRSTSDYAKGLRFLQGCQRVDGSWPGFEGDDEGSWATSLAIITLIRAGGDWESVQRGCRWLLRTRGQESHWLAKWRYRLFDHKVRFDPDKYGWPWTLGAASWVVPTAYSLMALRLAFACCLTPPAKQRIALGTAMLLDRACPGGGWNAGNTVAFGVPLEPHVDITSLALIALLPQTDHPTLKTSLSWLKSCLPTISSLNSACWTAMALARYRCDTSLAVGKLASLVTGNHSNPESVGLFVLASLSLRDVTCF